MLCSKGWLDYGLWSTSTLASTNDRIWWLLDAWILLCPVTRNSHINTLRMVQCETATSPLSQCSQISGLPVDDAQSCMLNREEKSLRHVSTVAKFLDDNKPKTYHLENEFALFHTSTISFNFTEFVNCWRNFLGLNLKWPYLSLEKKKKFLRCAHLLSEVGAWN